MFFFPLVWSVVYYYNWSCYSGTSHVGGPGILGTQFASCTSRCVPPRNCFKRPVLPVHELAFSKVVW